MEPEKNIFANADEWSLKHSFKSLGYLFYQFFTGVLYFVFFVTGISLGMGLLVTGLGVPVLAYVLKMSRTFMVSEKQAAARQYGESLGLAEKKSGSTGWAGYIAEIRHLENWKNVLFFLVKLPLGIVSLTIAMVFSALPLTLITVPLYYKLIPGPGMVMFSPKSGIVVDTFPEAIFCSVLGLVVSGLSILVITQFAKSLSSIIRNI